MVMKCERKYEMIIWSKQRSTREKIQKIQPFLIEERTLFENGWRAAWARRREEVQTWLSDWIETLRWRRREIFLEIFMTEISGNFKVISS